ncbi:MAG TPA: glycosyltransferase [Armatimonadota bacterium]|jgi:glycosyltransferase involved in cell wall biosynthesis
MKIAYLVGVFPTTRETFVSDEIIDLRRRGVDVEVFSWSLPGGEIVHPEVRDSGILDRVFYFRYRYLPRVLLTGTFWRTLAVVTWGRHRRTFPGLRTKLTAAYLAALIKQRGHRHLHIHFIRGLGRHVAAGAGLPYSFTAHCFEQDALSPEAQREYAEELERAPLAVAASEFVQRGMQGLVGPAHRDKIRLVRCGIAPDKFSAAEPGERPYDVICVAGFGPTKGIEYLIRAAALLRRDRPGVRIISVGGPAPFHREFADWLQGEPARAAAGEAFEFIGPCDHATVQTLLRSAKVFALPCVVTEEGRMDGLPVALMEAAAAGLPLVSTAVAGIPELVVDGVTGLLVPQRDPEALAAAIARLLEDEDLRARLGQAARRRVEEEFTRELNGQRLAEAFAAVVAD